MAQHKAHQIVAQSLTLLVMAVVASNAAAQPAGSDTSAKGSAAAVITSYLAAAATLDPAATKKFLAASCATDLEIEFQGDKSQGWSYSNPDSTIMSETINTSSATATVVAQVTFKGGSSPDKPTFMSKAETFSLIIENGAWKISSFDPPPQTGGPGVQPL